MSLFKKTHTDSHNKDKTNHDENWFVTVERAEGVEDKDRWTKSDTYVIIEFGDQTVRTHTINNSRTPFWNETFNLKVRLDHIKDFCVRLMDDDLGPDDPIGKAIISQQDLPLQPGDERYLRVPVFRKEQTTGIVILRVKRFDNLDNTTSLTTSQPLYASQQQSQYTSQQQPLSTSQQPLSTSQQPLSTSQQPLSTSQEQPQYTSQEQPQYTSQQQPQYTSQQQPQYISQQQPQSISQQQPQSISQQQPPYTSQQQLQSTSQHQPQYTSQQQSKFSSEQPHDITTSQQPYTSSQQSYTSSQQPYTSSQQPYTTTQQPYTASQQPYTTSQQPSYTTSQQPYTTSQQPYTTSQQPSYTTSQQPQHVAAQEQQPITSITSTHGKQYPTSNDQVSQQPYMSGTHANYQDQRQERY